MTIPSRFLDELRGRITLSEVVRSKVRLARAGREFKGCCPFHHEKTPSFYVNDEKQFYHCFGCGAHGSAIDFVMGTENLSFIEALETLAQKVGMTVPQTAPADIERSKEEKSLYALMDETTRFFEASLQSRSGDVSRGYLFGRGLDEETIHGFRIGYAPADRQVLRSHLLAKGYTDRQMLEAGVIRLSAEEKPSGQEGAPYAFFRDRVMFPVSDRKGRIVAFGGRILPDHLRPPDRGAYKPAKYMNSSETPLFHKGRMLYGESHARQAAVEGLPILVVEGYLDVIACFRAGFRGVVAPLGTALTEEQIHVLWRMIPAEEKTPVLCFDGDDAGRRAASRACARILPLLKPNHSAKIAFLPQGEDPDSLIRSKGPSAFQAVLDQSLNLVDFLWKDYTQDRGFDTPETQAGLVARFEEETAKITDRSVQHFYREAFRKKVRQAFSTLDSAQRGGGGNPPYPKNGREWGNRREGYSSSSIGFRKEGGGVRGAPVALSALRRPAFSRELIVPIALLASVVNNPDVFPEIEEELSLLKVRENELDQLRLAVLSKLSHTPPSGGEGFRAYLRAYLIDKGFGQTLEKILSDTIYTHASFARPCADPTKVLEGWRDAWKAIESTSSLHDLEQARVALKNDLTEENEARLKILLEERKITDI